MLPLPPSAATPHPRPACAGFPVRRQQTVVTAAKGGIGRAASGTEPDGLLGSGDPPEGVDFGFDPCETRRLRVSVLGSLNPESHREGPMTSRAATEYRYEKL